MYSKTPIVTLLALGVASSTVVARPVGVLYSRENAAAELLARDNSPTLPAKRELAAAHVTLGDIEIKRDIPEGPGSVLHLSIPEPKGAEPASAHVSFGDFETKRDVPEGPASVLHLSIPEPQSQEQPSAHVSFGDFETKRDVNGGDELNLERKEKLIHSLFARAVQEAQAQDSPDEQSGASFLGGLIRGGLNLLGGLFGGGGGQQQKRFDTTLGGFARASDPAQFFPDGHIPSTFDRDPGLAAKVASRDLSDNVWGHAPDVIYPSFSFPNQKHPASVKRELGNGLSDLD
ncbi:hypothetical protein K474DRAFT_1662749 [Panus rudis PR-1116 ss-1]|nr:hypothetical protein K474DRAFT_1662749 [Panus rudis PR-1116 ss-1]